jgi:hypothetical protein
VHLIRRLGAIVGSVFVGSFRDVKAPLKVTLTSKSIFRFLSSLVRKHINDSSTIITDWIVRKINDVARRENK